MIEHQSYDSQLKLAIITNTWKGHMLILSRHIDEEIYITVGSELIKIQVVDIRGDKVRLGVSAALHIAVHRREVHEAIQKHSRQSE